MKIGEYEKALEDLKKKIEGEKFKEVYDNSTSWGLLNGLLNGLRKTYRGIIHPGHKYIYFDQGEKKAKKKKYVPTKIAELHETIDRALQECEDLNKNSSCGPKQIKALTKIRNQVEQQEKTFGDTPLPALTNMAKDCTEMLTSIDKAVNAAANVPASGKGQELTG